MGMEMNAFYIGIISNAIFAAGASAGFGVSFNVPARILGICALGGATGRALRFILVESGIGIEWATLVAASSISVVGIFIAHRISAHPKAFTVAAIIPMIPGVPIFKTLIAIAKMQHQGMSFELLETALNSGLSALFIVVALAVGLAMPGLIFYRRKPLI